MSKEPAMILAAVQAILALAVSFGLHLTNEQIGAIMAVVTMIAGLIVRQHVRPVK